MAHLFAKGKKYAHRIQWPDIKLILSNRSNRLLMLMKRLGKARSVPGQVAMEQIMCCALGACYICVRTFEVNGEQILRRVCREGPVFDMQEAVGW